MRAHPTALLALAACMALAPACHQPPNADPAAPAPASPSGSVTPADMPVAPEPERRLAATLLWPGAEIPALLPRDTELLAGTPPSDLARQVVTLLLGPPPDAAVVPPLPAGTRLLALFVDGQGVATVSLSRECMERAPGGSGWEMLAVHSLAGSLTRVVPQIKRVQILVEGREIETLAGHLDLRGPVTFDEGLLAP